MPREPKKQETDEEKKIEEAEKIVEEKAKITIPEGWVPKTSLGKKVFAGEITDIDKVFANGVKIAESQIVDVLLPRLERDIILIGGSTGKGGGIRRTPFRRTSRMHKSGRRYGISVMVAIGNKNGYVGVGLANGPPGKHREIIEKAEKRAKLNVIPIKRGCGSWECLCGEIHSIPFAVKGKSGSIRIKLLPAPKGVGLVVSNEIKKVMSLAGIKDVWCKSRGQTSTRINHIKAVFGALKKLNTFRLKPEFEKSVGLKTGKVE